MKSSQKIKVLREVFRQFNRHAGVLKSDPYGLDLSLSQGSALVDIDRYGPLKPNDLVRLLSLEKSSISRLLAVLKKRRLLKIETDPQDRRSKTLQLTAQGRRAARKINDMADASVNGVFEKLGPKDQQQALQVFERLIEALQTLR